MGPPQIEAAERMGAAVVVTGKGHVTGNMAVTIPLEVKTTIRTQQRFIVCASQDIVKCMCLRTLKDSQDTLDAGATSYTAMELTIESGGWCEIRRATSLSFFRFFSWDELWSAMLFCFFLGPS